MSKYQTINHQQLELLEREVSTKQPAKRVNIVRATLVVELTEEVVGLDAAGDLVLTVDGTPVVVSAVNKVTAGTDKGKYYITGTDINDFTAKSTITLALKDDSETGTIVEDAAGNDAIFGQAIKIK